jgi:hypothetical protein
MWCRLGGPFWSVRIRDQIDKGEDDDPDDVNEVPVQPSDLDVDGLLRGQTAAQGEDKDRQMRSPRWSPRWIAESASTIVSEDMRSTKALTEV